MPSALAFAQKGSETLDVSGLNTGTAFQATAFGSPWLKVAQSGDANKGTVTVSADPTGLQPGTYRGAVSVTAAGASNSIPVSIVVGPENALTTSPASLSFVIQLGGAPVSQQLAVAGPASQSGVASLTATTGAAWLTTNILQGVADQVTVTANPSGMNAGTYHTEITIVLNGTTTILVPVLLQVGAVAPPVLTAVTSGVTYQPSTASPGLFVALSGSGMGPHMPASAALGSDGSLVNVIGDTRVLADGVPCPMLYASNNQVNAILPFGIAGRTSTAVQVEYLGVASNTVAVPVETATPGLFVAGASGETVSAFNQDGSINSVSNPAPQGSEVVLFAGGAGSQVPRTPDGSLTTSPFPVPALPTSVTIGGTSAPIKYAGSAPGEVNGVLQVNVLVPTGIAPGPQPVVLNAGTFQSQQNAVLYIK